MENKELIKELTILLMYLTSWEEKILDEKHLHAWKGYDFDIINSLEQEEMIYGSKKNQPIILSEVGIQKAKQVLRERINEAITL